VHIVAGALLVLGLAASCTPPEVPAALTHDAGVVAGDHDAGPKDDAGVVVDAGDVVIVDAGGVHDAGDVAVDGGVAPDAGGVGVDAGAVVVDAGPPPFTVPSRALCASGRVQLPALNAGPLGDSELVETSGLATSFLNDNVLWAHNDSGDTARVFAVGTDGAALGRVQLAGVTATDNEDIALATCPNAQDSCIWLADTGDNARTRADAQLVIFPEPIVDATGAHPSTVSGAMVVHFTYEGGPVDVEALAVTADGQHAFLFEKRDVSSVRAYELDAPFSTDVPMVARVVATFTPPGTSFIQLGRDITAADLHVSGTRLLLRVYSGIFEYRFGAGQGVANLASLTPSTLTLGPLSEPQGESIAYDGDGTGVFSVSEDPNQAPGRELHHFLCRP
jgi:hypothetical protein